MHILSAEGKVTFFNEVVLFILRKHQNATLFCVHIMGVLTQQSILPLHGSNIPPESHSLCPIETMNKQTG